MLSVSMHLSNAYSAHFRRSTLWIETHSLLGNPYFSLYRPDCTPLSALPGCALTQQYLLPFSAKTLLFVPLANDWHCVDVHDHIALHILQPLFIIPSDSSLGRQMYTGDDSPGRIKRRPIKALAVSATHKSPSWIQR